MVSDAAGQTDFDTVRELVEKLDEDNNLKLFEELEEAARRKRLAATIETTRERAKEHPIGEAEIERECEAVREEIYQRKQR